MKDYNYLSSELCKLGIKKKEADVYLILLESGYSSVKKIAQMVDLSRPTVYRILENLEKKNLINTTQKGKRNYFLAGSPDTLLNMLKIKKRQAEEQEREFLRIINVLQDQYSFSSKDNVINIFVGNEKKLALEKLANTQSPEILAILNNPNRNLDKIFEKISKKLGGKVKIKKIQHFESETKNLKNQQIKLFKNTRLRQGENIIITDKVFLFDKKNAQIIKQKETINFFRLMFEILWKNL